MTETTTQNTVLCTENAPHSVLFVCTGNTCRSPMAAALLSDLAARRGLKLAASSAGIYAAEGAPISENAANALLRAGVADTPQNHYTAHTARRVTEEMLATADEVVALSDTHAFELMMRFPAYVGKISTLALNIPDPFGGDQAEYDACLATLSLCVGMRWDTEACGED